MTASSLVDTGTKQFAPLLAATLRQKTQAPVHTAIYTHGHIDHAYGLDQFLLPGQKKPRVIAHSGHAGAVRALPGDGPPQCRAQCPASSAARSRCNRRTPYAAFGQPPIPPDTLYDDRLNITVGGETFELHHCKGETDDHTWVWSPTRRVLCPGDLFIWRCRMTATRKKVQRFAWERAKGLKEMAAKAPNALCPGHGRPR
ncbi:MAG: MBL fold metallo-hydrolase [Rhizomicrobium sp.]